MGTVVIFFFALVVGGKGLSWGAIHPRWPIIYPKSAKIHHLENAVARTDGELRETCECGVKRLSKIVGGNYATRNEYPWMAALCYPGSCNVSSFFCGGSLINDQYILTAAHCLVHKVPRFITVSLGDHSLNLAGERGSVEYKGERMISHRGFSGYTLENDIAVIKLATKVKMSDKISPICLPSGHQSYVGKSVYLSGWGSSIENGPTADTLKEVALEVNSRQECLKAFTKYPGAIAGTMICAHANGKESNGCKGDSGGPLVMKKSDGYYEQIGVVTGGINCTDFRYPAVFTKVGKYLSFIERNTKKGYYCTENIRE